MNKILTALGTASLLALSACGGGGSEANNAAAVDPALTGDNSLTTLPADETGADLNGLGADANLSAVANLAADANATATNTSTDATGNLANSQ